MLIPFSVHVRATLDTGNMLVHVLFFLYAITTLETLGSNAQKPLYFCFTEVLRSNMAYLV